MTSSFRIRLWAGAFLLVGLAFVQDPGLLIADTKFDLVEAPLDFLGRAAHAWDGEGAFGQLQNQAYGYFWPMGPFFAIGWLLDVPGWVVQRLWLALVLVVAFVGAAKVARAFGVRSDLAALLAGLAYALSPRMLTTLGPISIEAWPSALAPWVLLALVRGSESGSPRRWAALAALGVAMVGGVNAAATFAVIPMGVVWLLTRESGPRRRSLLLWWPIFTLLGTLWWLVPLFVLGAYSPSFLDYIETTDVTTFPTTMFDTLRGTSNWVPYVDPGSRAGNDLITTWYLALDGGALLLLGIAGLMLPTTRHRVFLALSLLVGVVMVTAGHHGAVEGWFVDDIRALLDGSLAPLRNVHKFDPIVRLPLVLGAAFVVDTLLAQRPADLAGAINRGAVLALAIAALAGSTLPAVSGRIAPAGATLAVPEYWQQTADWLADKEGDGAALLVPGSAFGTYQWGSPHDEPMQWLAGSRWAVRNVIPLAPEGNIRMLDEIEKRLAQGDGSTALTAQLRRAGISHLVVRNDLRLDSDVPDPVLVHQAIAESPGLTRVATFGPQIGGEAWFDGQDGSRVVVNGGWQASHPAVEVYSVSDAASQVVSSDASVVVGGPEDLADVGSLGGPAGALPALLAADLPASLRAPLAAALADRDRTPLVLTDGLRSRERSFARIHDGSSATRTPEAPRRTGGPARDYLPSGWDEWSTLARVDGAESVTASSSMADADTVGGTRRGAQPFAAVDGDLTTSWVSQRWQDDATWWELRLRTPTEVTRVEVTGGADAEDRQLLRIRTEAGVSEALQVGPGETRTFRLHDPDATWLRVEEGSGAAGRQLHVAEVAVPGVTVQRRLVLPDVPREWGDPDVVLLRRDADPRNGCLRVDGRTRCVPGRAVPDEEPSDLRRTLELHDVARWRPELTVSPRPGPALDQLLLRGQPAAVTASSTAVPDPRASSFAAVDGDPGTAWLADPDDLRPALDLRWLGERRVSRIRLALDPGTAGRLPTRVRLTWPGGEREVRLRKGRARFPELRTDRLQIEILETDGATSLGFDGQGTALGAAVGEVRLGRDVPFPMSFSEDPVELGCGSGPTIDVDGARRQTSVVAAPAALLRGETATSRLCRPAATGPARPARDGATMPVPAGVVDLDVEASPAFVPDRLVLRRSGDPAATGPTASVDPVDGDWLDPVTRLAEPPSDERLLVLRENSNQGWEAQRDGTALTPVVVDGWQQGWWLEDAPGGDPSVQVDFAPDRIYRLGMLAGGSTALVLLALLAWSRRWREDPEPVGDGRVPMPLLVGLVLLATGVIGGWAGLAIGANTAAVALAARRAPSVRSLLPWLAGAVGMVGGVAYAVQPWGASDGWAGEQAWLGYLLLVPLVGIVVAAAGSRTRALSRSAGRSTRR